MLPIQHFVSLLLVCSISPVLLVDGQKKLIAPRWIPKSRPFKGENNVAQLTGSDINLTCPASGNPTPKTTWYKNGDWFNASQRLNTETRRFSLLLNDTQTSDTGEYSCVVHNSEGSLNFTYTVNIIRRPWPLEVEEPQNVTVMEGERVVFRCRVLNDPDATTQWIKRDTEVGDTGGYNKDVCVHLNIPSSTCNIGPEIVIESASPKDTGKYTCMAKNYIGIKLVDVWLTVRQTTTTTTTTITTNQLNNTTTTTTTATTTYPTIITTKRHKTTITVKQNRTTPTATTTTTITTTRSPTISQKTTSRIKSPITTTNNRRPITRKPSLNTLVTTTNTSPRMTIANKLRSTITTKPHTTAINTSTTTNPPTITTTSMTTTITRNITNTTVKPNTSSTITTTTTEATTTNSTPTTITTMKPRPITKSPMIHFPDTTDDEHLEKFNIQLPPTSKKSSQLDEAEEETISNTVYIIVGVAVGIVLLMVFVLYYCNRRKMSYNTNTPQCEKCTLGNET